MKPTRTPSTAAKVPLHNFMKLLGKLVEVIRKSKDKDEVKFYIDMLRDTMVFKNKVISVQCYYYFYITFQKEIF